MSDKPVIVVLGVKFHGTPEEEEKFNNWYNTVHSPFVFSSERVKKAARYKLHKDININAPEPPTWLAIYQFENRQAFEKWYNGPEFAAALEQRRGEYPDEVFERKICVAFECVKSWEK